MSKEVSEPGAVGLTTRVNCFGQLFGAKPGELWASLVAQMVKNLAARLETWIRSLGRKDPLKKGMATHSSVRA